MKELERISKLMLIDDDEIILTVNRHIIEQTGKVDLVLTFPSANKALAHLMTTDRWPEVILCDIHMPMVDGWEFIDRYTELLKNSIDPSMLCVHSDISSDIELDELEKRKAVDMFITKPLTREKLALCMHYFHNKFSLPEYINSNTKFVTA